MKWFNRSIGALALLICLTQSSALASSSYKEDMARGMRQMEKKDYESAVAAFTDILRDNPNVYEAYLNRALARFEIKDYEGSLSDYDQAIKINPNVVESYLKRADLNIKLNDLNAAIADYTQALRLNPKESDAYLKRAQAYKQNGDYGKAADDLSSASKLNPNSLEIMQERAECRMKAYEPDAAIIEYNDLMKKFKAKAGSMHYKLGEALELKGDKTAAKAEYDQAIAFHSKNIKSNKKAAPEYVERALAYAKVDDYDKAIADLEFATPLLPGDANSRALLGHMRLAKGDSKGAIKNLNEALSIDAKLPAALIDRAEAYVAEGNFVDAQKDLDIALAGEKNPDALLSRAIARLGMGDTSGAITDLQEVKNLSPKSIDHRKQVISEAIAAKEGKNEKDLALAQSMEQLALLELADNPGSSETLVKKAIDIEEKSCSKSDPKVAYTLMLLGRVHLKKHDALRAEALFRSAMTRLKNNPDGTQKYAVFNLEDCAKTLISSSSQEAAGAILIDTRQARATSGLTERAFTGDMSRKAERAIEAYKQKKRVEEKQEEARKLAAGGGSSGSSTDASETSEPVVASVQAPPLNFRMKKIDKPIRDKWAVIVGISNFKDSNINLKYSSKDAHDFYDFLIKEKNFAPDHVQLLTDGRATRANVLSLLGSKWLPRVAEPDDLVIIYWSGHGSPSSLDAGGVNYLVAYDTDVNDLYSTAIAMQDLTHIIKERVHSERVMILLDACHSGAVAPSSKGLARAANVNVDNIVQGTGQLVLSSSSPDQRSWESKRYSGSVFTKHLIDGLRKNGKMTTLGDAYSYLNEEVQREVQRDRGEMQNPVMKSKWEGSDLIIGVPGSSPSRGMAEVELPDDDKVAATKDEPTKKRPLGKDKPKAPSAKHAK